MKTTSIVSNLLVLAFALLLLNAHGAPLPSFVLGNWKITSTDEGRITASNGGTLENGKSTATGGMHPEDGYYGTHRKGWAWPIEWKVKSKKTVKTISGFDKSSIIEEGPRKGFPVFTETDEFTFYDNGRFTTKKTLVLFHEHPVPYNGRWKLRGNTLTITASHRTNGYLDAPDSRTEYSSKYSATIRFTGTRAIVSEKWITTAIRLDGHSAPPFTWTFARKFVETRMQ